MPSTGFRASLLALTAAATLALAAAQPPLADAQTTAASQADRVAGSVNSGLRAQIPGHVPAWASASADSGPVASSESIHLLFGITRSAAVQAAFDQLVLDQQTPGSPRYQQWLTPAQIGQLYGPTQHDVDAMTTWLTGQGFTVDEVSPTRTFIDATAPAAIVEAALHTGLHNFALPSGNLRAPAAEPSMPAALAPVVSFISGLTVIPKQMHHVKQAPVTLEQLRGTGASTAAATQAQAQIGETAAASGYKPAVTLTGGGQTVHWILPGDFAVLYDLNGLYNAGTKGTGERVMIIGGSQLTPADLTAYEGLANLASYTPTYITPPGLTNPGQTQDDSQGEGMLDFERVYGTAPGAGIDFVISKNWLTTDTDTLENYAIQHVVDPVMSISYGACEAEYTSAGATAESAIFQNAAAAGISVFVSSGDGAIDGCAQQGVAPPANPVASIEIPCSSPYVTCVGGTEFSDTANPGLYWSSTNTQPGYVSALSYIPEGGWNEPATGSTPAFIVAGSTGGPSVFFGKPTWQTGTGVPADGVRDTPDIAFSSSTHNAYLFCFDENQGVNGTDCVHNYGGDGGTSAAAPSMAGITALLVQKTGKSQGLLNPTLYKFFASNNSVFHDASPGTSGVSPCSTAVASTCNNSLPSATALTGGLAGYPLTTGFDFVTGLGSLDVGTFIAAVSLPVPTCTVSASPAAVNINQTVTFTDSCTGGSGNLTGTIQFYSNGTAIGSAVAISSGVATLTQTFPLAATYVITAIYSGDGNNNPSTSNSLSFVVSNPNAIASFSVLTATPTVATTIQAVTLTVRVTGAGTATPTGTVLLTNTTAAGTKTTLGTLTLTGGVATLANNFLPAGTNSLSCSYLGDTNYQASACPIITVVVTALPTTSTLSFTQPVITIGGTETASVTVAGTGPTLPTGTVIFYSGTGQQLNLTPASLVNGVATFSFPVSNTAGVQPVYAIYSGDSIFASSTSATVSYTVQGFTLVSATPALTLKAGTSGTAAITLTSVQGFTGTVTLTCASQSTLTTGTLPTCLVSPATVTLAANGTGTATLTLGTTATHAISAGGISAGSLIPSFTTRSGLLAAAFASTLLFLLIPNRRRHLGNWKALSILVLLAGSLFALSGCSSGTQATTIGTPAGTYTFTVTGTVNGNTAVSTNIVLTVD